MKRGQCNYCGKQLVQGSKGPIFELVKMDTYEVKMHKDCAKRYKEENRKVTAAVAIIKRQQADD